MTWGVEANVIGAWRSWDSPGEDLLRQGHIHLHYPTAPLTSRRFQELLRPNHERI